MKKNISLLRAILTNDMNMFKYRTKSNSSKFKKMLLPIFLFLVVVSSILGYSILIGKELDKVNLNYVLLSMFIFMVTFLALIQGIYKSQSILFEGSDNDLLFSMPIKRSTILFARIFKLLIFQFIYNLMFLLPALITYVYFERPSISFYIVTLIYSLLIPVIPTVIASVLGYFIKLISSKSKKKKIMQTILSSIIFMGVFYLSYNLDGFVTDIAKNASSINEVILKIYYPLGVYIDLINSFSVVNFIKLLIVNIVPLVLFIIVCQKYYFKIISNLNNGSVNNKKYNKDIIRVNKPMVALVKKELNRYLSSVTLMFNSSFGLILMVIISILLCIKGSSIFDYILSVYGIKTDLNISILFYFLVFFTCMMTSITSSFISLEGKSINITKSMPISYKSVLISKILLCYLIELPFIMVSIIMFSIRFKISLFYVIMFILLSLVSILLSSSIGLLANLKYPKMEFSSDVEVVKQSISSMISVFSGMIMFIVSTLGIVHFSKYLSFNVLIVIHTLLIGIISFVLYYILVNKGVIEYKNINV